MVDLGSKKDFTHIHTYVHVYIYIYVKSDPTPF